MPDEGRVSRALQKFGRRPKVYSKLPFPKYPYYPRATRPSAPQRKDAQDFGDSPHPDLLWDFRHPPDGQVSALKTHFTNRSKNCRLFHKRSASRTPYFVRRHSRKSSASSPGPRLSPETLHENPRPSDFDKRFISSETRPSRDMVTSIRNDFMKKNMRLSGGMAPWSLEAAHLARKGSHGRNSSGKQAEKRKSLTEKFSDFFSPRHFRKASEEFHAETREITLEQSRDRQADLSPRTSKDRDVFVSTKYIHHREPDLHRRHSKEDSKRGVGGDDEKFISRRHSSRGELGLAHKRSDEGQATSARRPSQDAEPGVSRRRSHEDPALYRGHSTAREPEISRRISTQEVPVSQKHSNGEGRASRRRSSEGARGLTSQERVRGAEPVPVHRRPSDDRARGTDRRLSGEGEQAKTASDVRTMDHARRHSRHGEEAGLPRKHSNGGERAPARRHSKGEDTGISRRYSKEESELHRLYSQSGGRSTLPRRPSKEEGPPDQSRNHCREDAPLSRRQSSKGSMDRRPSLTQRAPVTSPPSSRKTSTVRDLDKNDSHDRGTDSSCSDSETEGSYYLV